MTKLSLSVGSTGLNLILLVVLVLIGFDCLINSAGLWDLTVLKRDRAQIEEIRDRLQTENAQRKETIARLGSDETYLQRLIHQELGYVRSDELIYRFPKASAEGGSDPNDSRLQSDGN